MEGLLQIQSSFHTSDNKSHDQLPLIISGLVIIMTADFLRCGSMEAAGFGAAEGLLPPTRTSLWTRLEGLTAVYVGEDGDEMSIKLMQR